MDFSVVIFLTISLALNVNGTRNVSARHLLCSRIFFSTPPLDTFPYKSTLEAVYIKTNITKYNFPVYRHERDGGYFLYNSFNFYFSQNINDANGDIRVSSNNFIIRNDEYWRRLINNETNIFGNSMNTNKLQYLEQHNTTRWHRNYISINPVCVQFSECQTDALIFKVAGNLNRSIGMNYFKAKPGLYTNKRPVYEYLGNPSLKLYLFYHTKHWIIGDNYFKAKGIFSVKSDVLKPEYIYQKWQQSQKNNGWTEVNSTLQCFSNISQCTPNLCQNNGYCRLNLVNKAFCVCPIGFTGQYCETKSMTCTKQPYPNINNEVGAIAARFCHEGYYKKYQVGLCHFSDKQWSGFWRSCYSTTTRRPSTTPFRHVYTSKSTSKPFNMDKYLPDNFYIYLIVIVTLLICFIPMIHRIFCSCGISAWQLYSFHWYIGTLLWIAYISLFYILNLQKYGYIFSILLTIGAISAGVMYIYVLVESCCSSDMKYMLETEEESENMKTLIHKIISTPPNISIVGECWHNETRTRVISYTDANGNSQTRVETYQEKVITWSGVEIFQIRSWHDNTDLSQFNCLEKVNKAQRLRFHKTFDTADEESEQAFRKFKTDFDNKHRNKDVYYSSHVNFEIDGFKERVLFHGNEGKNKPVWMNCGCFCLFTLLHCSWPFRLCLRYSTDKQEFTFRKLISIKDEIVLLQHQSCMTNAAYHNDIHPTYSPASAPPMTSYPSVENNAAYVNYSSTQKSTRYQQSSVDFQPQGVYYNPQSQPPCYTVPVSNHQIRNNVGNPSILPPSYAESCENHR